MMKFLGYDKVFCLSPHPDDVEYSILGTMMKYRETSFSVLCMTKGGTRCVDTVDLNAMRNRVSEVNEAWKTADLDNVNICFPDCDFLEDKDRDPGWVSYIENEFIKDNSYDCILMPPRDDSMFEHRFVNGLGPPLARHSPISLIEYRTPSTLNSWHANLFVDIGVFYDKKLEILKCFRSQREKSYFSAAALGAFHINFQCGKKGINMVEQFKIIEMYKKA